MGMCAASLRVTSDTPSAGTTTATATSTLGSLGGEALVVLLRVGAGGATLSEGTSWKSSGSMYSAAGGAARAGGGGGAGGSGFVGGGGE